MYENSCWYLEGYKYLEDPFLHVLLAHILNCNTPLARYFFERKKNLPLIPKSQFQMIERLSLAREKNLHAIASLEMLCCCSKKKAWPKWQNVTWSQKNQGFVFFLKSNFSSLEQILKKEVASKVLVASEWPSRF